MATHNVLLSTLVISGVPIPLGGSDTFAEAVIDQRATKQKTLTDVIFSMEPVVSATITITCYATDPANAALRKIAGLDDAALGQLPGGGAMTDSAGQALGFAKSKITQVAGVAIERESGTRAWTIETGRCVATQTPVLP